MRNIYLFCEYKHQQTLISANVIRDGKVKMATTTTRKKRNPRKTKNITPSQSKRIIERIISKDEKLNFKNHRKSDLGPNTYRFTVDLLSLNVLISLMEHEKVKNVYFLPAKKPPAVGEDNSDSISMRYKVHVEYHLV